MVVRRSDSRRRRVVVDPALQTAESIPLALASETIESNRETSLYAIGANRRHQHKTTDLIPKRVRAVAFVVMLLLATVGLLNLLAINASDWTERLGTAGVASFSLTGRGTLAGWFSSFLLIISGLASLQIYALRQHRRDDYHGSYRLWLWMAMLLLLGSVNCVVDLTTVASRLLQSLTSISLGGNAWWPLAIKLGLLSTLIARGLYEVRESRGSFALVVFVWVAYSGSAVMQMPAIEPAMSSLAHESTLGNCFLLATVALILAEFTFARFIYLQAHGLIKAQRVKVKKKKAKSTAAVSMKKTRKKSTAATTVVEENGKTELKIAGASVTTESKSRKKPKLSKAGLKTVDQESAESSLPDSGVDEDENEGILNMSKAERRRQRKENQQQRRAA